jgi:hypothetical protein
MVFLATHLFIGRCIDRDNDHGSTITTKAIQVACRRRDAPRAVELFFPDIRSAELLLTKPYAPLRRALAARPMATEGADVKSARRACIPIRGDRAILATLAIRETKGNSKIVRFPRKPLILLESNRSRFRSTAQNVRS